MNELKNIRYYLSGILVSQLGSHLFLIAMSIWLTQTYGSALKLGTFLFLSSITTVILSPFLGVLIDRLNPQKIMVYTDLISGLLMIGISILMTESIQITYKLELIYLLAFICSCMTAAFTPSSLTLVGQIVKSERIKEINGKSSNLTEISRLLGRSFAGIILIIINAPVLIFINGISFLISSFFESKIVIHKSAASNKKSPGKYLKELSDGFQYLMGNKLLIYLFIGAAITNFFMVINGTLLPILIKDVLEFDLSWFGIVMSATGLGALLGGYYARKLSKEKTQKVFILALIMQGLPYSFVPLCDHPMMIFFLMFLVGICYVFVQVNMLSLVTHLVSNEYRGRIFSLMYMTVSLFIPISYLFTGLLGDLYRNNISDIYYLAGFAMATTWLVIASILGSRGELQKALAC